MLLPHSGLVDEVQAQRVVVVGHRGQHRPNVFWTYLGVESQDQRDAPAASVAQPPVQEVREVRRNRRMRLRLRGFRHPPAANEASTTATSAAKVGCSYRSCGVMLRPSLAALIAMLIAIRESPPSSKKLAFRSTELTPKHCDQMRCNVASVCDCPGRATLTVEESVEEPTGEPLLSAGTCDAQTVCLGSTQCRWRANG